MSTYQKIKEITQKISELKGQKDELVYKYCKERRSELVEYFITHMRISSQTLRLRKLVNI